MAPQQIRKNGGGSCVKINRLQPTSFNCFAPDVNVQGTLGHSTPYTGAGASVILEEITCSILTHSEGTLRK
jgi:hypothetical protein